MSDLTIGHGTPLVEYKNCCCCGSKNLKKVKVNNREYQVCEDCLDEGFLRNLELINDIGE